MTWLFTQVLLLMLAAFLVGGLGTYLVLSRVLPHVDRINRYPEQDGEH
jgi:hypothetical protein